VVGSGQLFRAAGPLSEGVSGWEVVVGPAISGFRVSGCGFRVAGFGLRVLVVGSGRMRRSAGPLSEVCGVRGGYYGPSYIFSGGK
jgi:hypothetical protein